MRKNLMILVFLSFLLLAGAGAARAGSLSFFGFTLGDSVTACGQQLQQLYIRDQIEDYRVINDHQVAADFKVNGSAALLILDFKNNSLDTMVVAGYTSPDLARVTQQIGHDFQDLVKKFGNPTQVAPKFDADTVNGQEFTDLALWSFADGQEIVIGIYNNNRSSYSMYLIIRMAAAADAGDASDV